MTSTNTSWDARVTRSTRQLALWTFAWIVTCAFATFGPIFAWNGARLPSIAAVLVNVVVGLGMIQANRQHLLSLDEMQQRIHLNAMGLALGVALVLGLAYSMLDIANVIMFDAEISHLVVVMGITYGLSVLVGFRSYR